MLQKVRLYFPAVLQIDLLPLLLFTVASSVATTDVTTIDASSVLRATIPHKLLLKMRAGKLWN